MARVALPDGVVSMSAAAADGLLELNQGDAALLYVALLRHGGELTQARRALAWTQGRLDAAYAALQGLQLVGPAPAEPDKPLEDRAAPEYVTRDVVEALAGDPSFDGLRRQVERQLGSVLSPADLKTLYTVYDYLALPPEVILTLTAWCVEEMERKYGPGRRPRMSQVKKEAYRWRDQGVDTLGAAEEFLRGQKALNLREKTILPLVGVRDRPPLDREREYVAAWVDWGFPDESIAMAYEKTLLKKQSMSWPYMNSILKSWHAKGLHTPQEIRRLDAAPKAGPAASPKPPAQTQAQREERADRNIAVLKRVLNQKK